MVNGNTGTLTMRLVRSKLRKREETLSAATTNATTTIEIHEENANTEQPSMEHQQQCQSNPESNNNSKAAIVKNNKNGQQVTFVRTQGTGTNDHVNVIDNSEWTFPPKAPTPHIYHCINPELLVDKSSFKGFRKQFSGRFKRLVARKPEPAPVIPPELKPQLKTIYVY
ncbi:uncharacterized protein Dwil_GK13882 [Drosophila willistoni]|uniref:Uncharacterized protein n=1 Tax=Drosophila willistoni TaxID=7260 RepID=B4NJV6_DROWI|nr:uncharacterized protein LOC6650910 [Drosophila willistoni]EDW83958.2 uncharacterized protein Dwil_GK13882 [Drosophila willistoni]